MKILALSDTHGLLPELDIAGIGMVLIAGDVCPATDHSPMFQRLWLERCFHPWAEALNVPVYLTLGNHDFIDNFPVPTNVRYSTQAVIDGILLFSWVPQFYDWAWMASEDEIAERLNAVLAGSPPAIWVTHGPPLGVCDEVEGRHRGSAALRKAIETHCPRLVVCGHLHEGAAEGRIRETKVQNVSILDDQYHLFRDPVMIDILVRDEGKAGKLAEARKTMHTKYAKTFRKLAE